jgi:hypothetical protein
MAATDVVSERAVDHKQVRDSSADVNRRSDGLCHLENPHNKALAALFYTSLLRGAWEIVVHGGGSLFHVRRASNARALPGERP